MTIVRVAIPVKKGKHKFHLAKGRPWSLVEQIILWGVVEKPRTVGELAAESDLPRRLVLEVLIRLMRAGWVELSQRPEGVLFSASSNGISVVDYDELPHIPKHVSRWMNFVIDQITGTLYRSRELPFFERHVVQERARRECLVWMSPREIETIDRPGAIIDTLFEDDEKFLGVDPAGGRLVDRYAIVTVRNGNVEGLPPRAPKELNNFVLEAAKLAPSKPLGESSQSYRPAPLTEDNDLESPRSISAAFQSSDLIMGGAEHEELFKNTIRKARNRIIILSTFISDDKFDLIFPLLHDAAKRGVVIDILWGEDEEKTGTKTTRAVVERLRKKISETDLESVFRVHPFSTRSHAKIIVSDDGRSDGFFAIVGSCNWLASGFYSYETSVRLREPKLVSQVLDQMAELTRGADGHWTELTSDFARLAADARAGKELSGGRAQITVVLGPQHASFVRKARDESKTKVFVTSHRLGAATRPAIVVPAIAAAQDRGVRVNVYYGTISGHVSNTDAANIVSSAAGDGVRIQTVSEPRLHAKMLAWDDDDLLVTSQNWLSADPSEANLRREIGIYIQYKNIARIAAEGFEAMRRE